MSSRGLKRTNKLIVSQVIMTKCNIWSHVTYCVILINIVGSLYDGPSSKPLFDKYKEIYDKKYEDFFEEYAFINFVRNLNDMTELNKINKIKGDRSYSLNRYADQDPEEFFEQFGVKLKPYDYVSNENDPDLIHKNNPQQKSLEDLNMYDLDDAEETYVKYKEIYRKRNSTRNRGQANYLKFYKTLVEDNYKKMKGEKAHINVNSDKLKHPNEFYVYED